MTACRCIHLATLAAVLLAGSAAAQQQGARAEGKAFGETLRDRAQQASQVQPDESRLPNYDRDAARGLETLAEQPDRIEGAAAAAATGHAGYRAVRESAATRARFPADTIAGVTARARAINRAPLDYTSGMTITGERGACVPLPPGSSSAGTFTATCNTGTRIDQSEGQCTIPLAVTVSRQSRYHYLCNQPGAINNASEPDCGLFGGHGCRETGARATCVRWGSSNGQPWCIEPGDPVTELTCDSAVAGQTPYDVTTSTSIAASKDEGACASLAGNADCTPESESCTDAAPQTRIVEGVAVTQPCWAWQRSYSCAARSQASDCSTLEERGDCRFLREECLDDDDPCRTWERVYECPLPPTGTVRQYVCDGDVYCIDGSCETIERTASDEFRDAVVALHAMDEARGAFDPNSLTLFRGTRETCSSKIFGVLNCCKGKGFPLIPGISLLVALGCEREEVLLHQRDAQGLCTYVGSYCASSVLGICVTKRKAYCCFESRLSRILQEQGRRQLPRPWGKPREEQCQGFTLDEFARLDLSQMDFSEVYAEFTEAARLPDELETSALIQQKIADYYAGAGR